MKVVKEARVSPLSWRRSKGRCIYIGRIRKQRAAYAYEMSTW